MGIYKKGNNWYVDYYLKGRRKRKKVGPSKKLAEQVLKDIQVKIAKGEYLGIFEEEKVLFSDFVQKYLAFSKTNKAFSSYKRDLVSSKNLLPAFGEKYLFEITPQMVEEYKAKRLQEGVTPATVNRELSCLRHLFNKAIEWGYLTKNPLQRVKLLKEPPGRIRYLKTEEIERLLKTIDSFPQYTKSYLKPIVVIALNTGLRKGEILRLRWKDVDFIKKRITVNVTKTNEIRTVPMNELLYQELKKMTSNQENEYMFCNKKGKPFENVRKSFDRALKIAGIDDFRFHDLRHTFASYLVMSGCDIRTVQQLMGHKDIKMTMRYSHLSKSHLQEAVERLDNLWTLYGHQNGFGENNQSDIMAKEPNKIIV
ncbi:MAG: tyrosine-type recombinase/integrase [Candidatus Paceibacterota bacterium]|jgi:integrase